MEKPEVQLFIHKDLKEVIGSNESSSVHLTVDIQTGKAELVIEKTIREHYPVPDYDKVMDLYERLNCGGGRKVFKLEDLAHKY